MKIMPVTNTFDISEYVLINAVVLSPQHYVFLAHKKQSLNDESPMCELIEYWQGKWTPLAAWAWQAVALVDLPDGADVGVLVLGRDGQVGSWIRGQIHELQLDPSRSLGPFRGICRFREFVFAYGMGREVYQRKPNGVWVRCMRGIDDYRPRLKLGGFNGVAVDLQSRLTAVGMRGEIWLLENDVWRCVDTPTNIMLRDLVADGDGKLYACGLAGVLLTGCGDTWSMVTYDGPSLDFCAAGWFNGRLYLADGHSLRVMNGSTFELVNHGADSIVPCSAIATGLDTLLSIAGQEVWESSDGISWKIILG